MNSTHYEIAGVALPEWSQSRYPGIFHGSRGVEAGVEKQGNRQNSIYDSRLSSYLKDICAKKCVAYG